MRHDCNGGRAPGRSTRLTAGTDTISVSHVLSSMSTSELSNALNPNVVRQRDYDNLILYQDQQAYFNLHNLGDLPPQPPQCEYVPHRSELELAVVEPTPAQRYPHMLLSYLCSSNEFVGRGLSPLILHRNSCGS